VAIAKDGKHILSGGNDRTVRLWDAVRGTELRAYEGHANSVIQVAFGGDRKTVLSGGSQYRQADAFARQWDLATGRLLQRLEGREAFSVAALAFSADGRMVLTGGSDKSLRLWHWK
jgi:WD40 repeat protein